VKIEINKFEFEYLKYSEKLQQLARETNRTVKDFLSEHCKIEEEIGDEI
jgi:hypothetical protein